MNSKKARPFGGEAPRQPSSKRRPERFRDSGPRRDSGAALASAPPPAKPAVDASAFGALGLAPDLVRALGIEGYATPTPIQTRAIPPILAGSDLVGCAQTGTGKTAAFVLPLLQRLGSPRGVPRALVLTPTRELALQIGERSRAYGRHLKLRQSVIYGGVNQRRQERDLERRPEVLVATPGRLLDLMRQGFVDLSQIEILVLDEADTMLDMGFIHDIKRVVAEVPRERQTLLFSATMPAAIQALVRSLTRTPVHVSVDPESTPAERVSQSVFFVARQQKKELLYRLLDKDALDRVLVFTRTKHGANRLAEQLSRTGIGAAAIHGNKSQNARELALGNFRVGKTPVLVATDVAARGIDVRGVSLVVNFDLPNVPESYVHRIGRTGRAGAEGRAISFCDRDERGLLRDIERLIRRRIDIEQHELAAREAAFDRDVAGALPGQSAGQVRPQRPQPGSRDQSVTPASPHGSRRRPFRGRRSGRPSNAIAQARS